MAFIYKNKTRVLLEISLFNVEIIKNMKVNLNNFALFTPYMKSKF